MSIDLNVQRSKKACISCRQRKRKCDGQTPCTYCVRNEHDCEYETSRKRLKRQYRQRLSTAEITPNMNEAKESSSEMKLLEANSPAVFVRKLGLKINPSLAPQLSCYAWNLGLDREIACLPHSPRIPEILTVSQMRELAAEYFVHIAPVYNFLEREYVEDAIMRRWQNPSHSDQTDSLLCGVAGLGCLFSGKSKALETRVVHCARNALEHSSSLSTPEIDHVLGWLLRVIYLRTTSSPHATWMASCTLMHLIETTKLHLEPSENWILTQPGKTCQPDLRRRIYWVAQLFNIWVSSDCGKSRVELRGATSELPNQIWTREQQELCYLSCSLAQKFDFEASEMEDEISDLCALSPVQPMLQLLQCNIALCFFRRARALGRSLSDENLCLILDLSKNSLQVVSSLIKTPSPWWHIVNIPFQIVCVLLVVDNDQALRLLTEALDTLKEVSICYKTDMVRESYEIACFLVRQERQRRLRKLEFMANALEDHKLHAPMDFTINTLEDGECSLRDQESFLSSDWDMNCSLADSFLMDSLFYDATI